MRRAMPNISADLKPCHASNGQNSRRRILSASAASSRLDRDLAPSGILQPASLGTSVEATNWLHGGKQPADARCANSVPFHHQRASDVVLVQSTNAKAHRLNSGTDEGAPAMIANERMAS